MDSCFLTQIIDEWISDIGDTTFWGWLITLLYIVSVIASYYYLQRLKRAGNRPMIVLWKCILVLVLLLGINKQLDFQTLMSAAGRAISTSQGWYEHRRFVQACFAKMIFAFCGIFCVGVIYTIRTVLLQSVLELLGATVLIVFTLIRTSSLSNLHKAQQLRFDHIPHIHALELLGLLLILSAIGLGIRKPRHHRAQSDPSVSSDSPGDLPAQ